MYPDVMPRLRAVHLSCTRLASRARLGSALGPRYEGLVRTFEKPLEVALRERRDNLLRAATASQGLRNADNGARESCLHGLTAPWLQDDLMRDLWCPAVGEMQIQLLSFTMPTLFPPERRLAALACRDTKSRL